MTPFEKRTSRTSACRSSRKLVAPQPLEVADDGLLDLVVVRHPLVRRRQADAALHLDVIQVGLDLDDREAALLLEAGHQLVDDGRRVGRRQLGRRRDGQSADGRRQVERRVRSGGGTCGSRGGGRRRRRSGRRRLRGRPSGGRQGHEQCEKHAHRQREVEPQARHSERPRSDGMSGARPSHEFTGF